MIAKSLPIQFSLALMWIRAMSSIMEDATLAVKDLVTPLEWKQLGCAQHQVKDQREKREKRK